MKVVDKYTNPLIEQFILSPLVADPSVLTPEATPDRKWHLFTSSIFGVQQYVSVNGLDWKLVPKIISGLSYRPFISKDGGKYYLFYEKVKPMSLYKFPFYDSSIELRSSADLVTWSKPTKILSKRGSGNIGNPCVVKVNKEYHLYFSSSLVYLPDLRFCEPRIIKVATSKSIVGPYRFLYKSALSRGQNTPNVSSCRVYKTTLGFICLQTNIYKKNNTRPSSSAIFLGTSPDGVHWSFKKEPILKPSGKGWNKSFIYVGDLKKFKGKYYIYYNARGGYFWSKESIGLITFSTLSDYLR